MTTRDIDIVQRLQSAERWLAADLAIRGLGCVLLGLCALAAWWLYRMVQRPPAHPVTLGEFATGAGAVISWACGWALLGEGQGLFRLVVVPGRHARFKPTASRTGR
ncbi:hypothetical protein [Hephaestia mangrovi]|uniref:hypothetical protein n=1 Tax=Hephaestia mangrovi TaxID=2873268 RepID=UPI001CA653BE|nr:hypothetical protein [Hephaestia mangrovi]MBY8828949.1 hypothetical protein [Hephaestia mangrovi]